MTNGGIEIGFDGNRLRRHVTPVDRNPGFNTRHIQRLQPHSMGITGFPMHPQGLPHVWKRLGRYQQLVAQLPSVAASHAAHHVAGKLAGGAGVHLEIWYRLPQSQGEQLRRTWSLQR